MEQKQLLMAEKCDNCDELFDLDFDLKQEAQLEDRDLEMKRKDEHFCWKCRRQSNKIDVNNALEESNSSEDELDFMNE